MSSEYPQLSVEEVLHRQVVPSWRYPDGTPMSCNFKPTSKDDGLLSTRIGSRMSPAEAYEEHVAEGWQSAGTWSFEVQEAELPTFDDSGCEDLPEHHASVDFRDLPRKQIERAATRIKGAAVQRGQTHTPVTASITGK